MKLIDTAGVADQDTIDLHSDTPREILLAAELDIPTVKITGGKLTLEFPVFRTKVEYDFDADTKTVSVL